MILLLIACGLREPTDAELSRRLLSDRARWDGVCAKMSTVGPDVLGIGTPGWMRLMARTRHDTHTAPTDAELTAAGLTRPFYDDVVADLEALDAQSVMTVDGGWEITVWSAGLSVSGSAVALVCSPTPQTTPHDEPCTPLAPGWWVCRDSS